MTRTNLDRFSSHSRAGTRLARLLIATALGGLLGACGGVSSGDTTVVVTPTSVTLQSKVKDTSASPVNGATITVATQSTSLTASTDAQGDFSLTMSLSALPPAGTNTDVVVVVNKDGYQTQVVTLSSAQLRRGGTLSLDQIALQLTALPRTKLAPLAGALLTRLGDGVLSGHSASNQYLQGTVVPGQITYTIDMGGFTALADAGTGAVSGAYPTMTLAGRFRGLQTDICPSQIEIYQLNGSVRTTVATLGLTSTPALLPSALDGSISTLTMAGIPTTALNTANGNLWVQLRAGDCDASAATDYDDFEFLDLTVTFNEPVPPT
ncbi:carboxypeptidase-like regulatory domain-containing protein [Leptothrix sp. BB-4]